MANKEETIIQNKIRVALCKEGCLVFRCNTGDFYTKWGQEVKIGQKGHSDLYGVKSDGRAIFIEVKTLKGKARTEQEQFIKAVKQKNALAGFARSVEDALKIVFPENY